MEKLYCTIYIVDVSQNPEEVDTITSRIVQLIEDHGGVIKRNNPWGKRRLAYPIHKRTSGFYVEIEFTANSHLNIPQIIEKEYTLNDRVLRYLTYVVTKKELIQREISAKRGAAGEGDDTSNGNAGKKPFQKRTPKIATEPVPTMPVVKEKIPADAPQKDKPAETPAPVEPKETETPAAASETAEVAETAEAVETTTEESKEKQGSE